MTRYATHEDRRVPATDVGRPVTPAAVVVAHLVPLTVLPSGVWRATMGFGFTMGFSPATLEASDIPAGDRRGSSSSPCSRMRWHC